MTPSRKHKGSFPDHQKLTVLLSVGSRRAPFSRNNAKGQEYEDDILLYLYTQDRREGGGVGGVGGSGPAKIFFFIKTLIAHWGPVP